MKLTDELNAEQKALGAFLAAMKDCHLDGAKMRKAMIDVLGLADSDKQATLGAVPDGWRSVADDVSSRVIESLAEMAIAPVLSKPVPESNRSFEYIDRDLVVKSITKIRRAISELSEYSRLSAAPKQDTREKGE